MPAELKADPATAPFIYADGVLNLHNTASIVKFYLIRADPSGLDIVEQRQSIAAQVAMPLPSFVETYAFFHSAINDLVEKGVLLRQDVDEAIRAQEG